MGAPSTYSTSPPGAMAVRGLSSLVCTQNQTDRVQQGQGETVPLELALQLQERCLW